MRQQKSKGNVNKRHHKKKRFKSRSVHPCELQTSCNTCKKRNSCKGKTWHDKVVRILSEAEGQQVIYSI